uniref:Secreted protein n=1 Tax=Panagrellus redivivus TaxID=6233 RepID=A0A7E4UYD0_PANRE
MNSIWLLVILCFFVISVVQVAAMPVLSSDQTIVNAAINDSDAVTSVKLVQHKHRHHHHHKKRRSLSSKAADQEPVVAGRPHKQMMLTKPYWPWP